MNTNPPPHPPPRPMPQSNQKLPQNPYQADDGHLFSAYNECLAHEAGAESAIEQVAARCLGYFLLEFPDHNAGIANEINLCLGDSKKMTALGRMYIDHVIRLFKSSKGETPPPSDPPSRPLLEDESLKYSSHRDIEPAPKDHKTAKRSALKRDNYSCMVTGLLDSDVVFATPEAERVRRGWLGTTTTTNFCHIFPPSTNWNLATNSGYSGNVWALVRNFSGIDGLKELDGDKAHSLRNGLTLAAHLRPQFDKLRLWFEEVPGRPHTYWVRTLIPVWGVPTTVVTFRSTSPQLDLPDPRYLKLHAAVCRVAQMSGAAEYVDKDERDVESMPVLAKDGSSAELLTARLQRAVLAS